MRSIYILLVKLFFSFAFLQWLLSDLFYWGKSLFSKIISHVLMELQTYTIHLQVDISILPIFLIISYLLSIFPVIHTA